MFNLILNRKQFLRSLVIGFFGTQLFKQIALAQVDNELVNISWRVPREQVKTVQEDLNFEGEIIPDKSTIEDDRGLPLIYILIGAVTLSSLAQTLLDIYKDARYGGLILRRNEKGKLEVENDSAIDSGTIIIDQGDEIKIIFKEEDQPQTKELIEALTPLVKVKKP